MNEVDETLQTALDAVAKHAVNTLRELELDFPESNTEQNLGYVIAQVLDTVYSQGGYSGVKDAVGMLECVKIEFCNKMSKGK